MSKTTKFVGLAVLSMTLVAGPVISAYAAGSDNPSPPASDSGKGKKSTKKDKSSAIDDQKFLAGYHAAYATIYDKHDYAAAIEQLKVWGERTKSPVIAGAQGSDSASLAFSALTAAKEQARDVLLIDTAGRLQNKSELMNELEKVVRVIRKVDATAPHAVLLVLDA
ncbi:hypothetical protein U6Y50_12205, partial [Cutibacterium acnes]